MSGWIGKCNRSQQVFFYDHMAISFAQPAFLWLLLLIPVILIYYVLIGRKRFGTLRYSSLALFKDLQPHNLAWQKHLLVGIRLLALILLVIALARPQERNVLEDINAEGIDIMLLVDISGSMRATDFKPNRLEAVKLVAESFVTGRSTDRIGLNVFAAESFLQCPLTTDLERLKEFIRGITIINERYDGTAIGLALAGGINRLRDSEAESRVIILLSDGRNNAGELDPITAAQMANEFGIKIYTIGAGTRGTASIPVTTALGVRNMQVQVDVDEKTLREIAQITDGRYFRAIDENSLADIYAEISRMETTEYEVREYVQHRELFMIPLLIALLLASLEFLLDKTLLRRFP